MSAIYRFLTIYMKRRDENAIDHKVYYSPLCNVVEIFTEGVLCQSGGLGNVEHDGVIGDDTGIF